MNSAAQVDPSSAQAASANVEELVAHILERYHQRHREELPELIRLAKLVESVHREHPMSPRGLARHLEAMHEELLEHMAKEENILFPMLLQGGNPMVVHPIAVMRDEHQSHGERIEQLSALTSGHQLPEDACATWRALYLGTSKLAADLLEHIRLENEQLFPGFEQRSPRGLGDGA